MSLLYECGWFTWPDTTAAQTINLVDTSLTPIALIISTKGPGAHGFTPTMRYSIGFGTRRGAATQSGCIGGININGASPTDTARVRNSTLLHVPSSTSGTDYTVALDSFGAGTIGVTASNGTNANGDLFFYQVWGGTNLTDAIVLNVTMNSAGATQAITGAGFQPDVLFALDSSLGSTGTITATVNGSFGFAASPTQDCSMTWAANDNAVAVGNMFWGRAMRSDAGLERLTSVASSDARWDLNSFDADGATLGVVDVPTSTSLIATFLFIKGGFWEAGIHTKVIDVGPDIITLSNGAMTPKGAVFLSNRSTFSGLVSNEVSSSFGSMDGLHQGGIGWTGNKVLPTVPQSYSSEDHAISEIVGTTESSTAEFLDFDRGSFNLNWSINNGSARWIGYLVFDESVTVEPPVSDPGTGSYVNQTTITLTSDTLGALIYYTTDGSTPTDDSTLYESPFVISSTATVKAIAYAGFETSTVSSAVITIVPISAVTINPNGGVYTTSLSVSLSATPGATIYYTLDDSAPTNASPLYTVAFTVGSSLTVKAIAYVGALFGAVSSAIFTIQDAVPSEICHADMTKKMLHQTFNFMQETNPALIPANNVVLGHWWLDMSVDRIKYRVIVVDEDDVSSEDWNMI